MHCLTSRIRPSSLSTFSRRSWSMSAPACFVDFTSEKSGQIVAVGTRFDELLSVFFRALEVFGQFFKIKLLLIAQLEYGFHGIIISHVVWISSNQSASCVAYQPSSASAHEQVSPR